MRHIKSEKLIGSTDERLKSPSAKNKKKFIKLLDKQELDCSNKKIESTFLCYTWCFLFVSKEKSKLHGNEKHSMEGMDGVGQSRMMSTTQLRHLSFLLNIFHSILNTIVSYLR